MKRLPTLLVYTVLAALGYAAGSRVPRDSHAARSAPATTESGTGTASRPGETRLKTPSEPTFAESRERLRELAGQTNVFWSASFLLEGKRPGQAQLEIERLFARATREELLAFFVEEDLTETAPSLLSAAYARLAALSPEEAAAVWSDEFRRTGKGPGLDGLVRSWAGQDVAAAERWVDGLSDPNLRGQALAALLDGALETSPDLVERRLTELGGGDQGIFQSVDLAARLAWRLDPQRFESLAGRFLSEKRGRWEYQNELVALLEVWGERDGTAMMAWLLRQPPGSLKDHVIPRIVEARAKTDPAAFVREITPNLADSEPLSEMAGQAWLKWLEKGDDDEGAMAWFRTHGETLKLSQRIRWDSGNWTAEKTAKILPLLAELPDDDFRTQTVRSILSRLSQTDPKSALAHGRDLLPPGQETDYFVASTLENLARTGDPGEALDWAMGNLQAGQGQSDAVRFVMTAWAESAPLAAVERARALPDKLRDDAYSGIAYRWVEKAPEQVLKYLKSAPDPGSVSSLAHHAFWSFGSRGGEAYLGHALALPNEAMRSKAVEGLFGGWARANLESSALALDRLESGPLRDVAIATFASTARWTDREAAVTWSLEIADPAKRRQAAMQQSRYWLNADREAATRWIETSAKLPEEWKAELLKPVP